MVDFIPLETTPLAAENLLPTGLPDLLGYETDTRPTLVFYSNDAPKDGRVPIRKLSVEPISKELVLGQRQLGEVFPDQQFGPVLYLGPRTQNFERFSSELVLPFLLNADPSVVDGPKAIGIIDAGISFWNPGFSKEKDSRRVSPFKSFGALTVGEGTGITLDRLTPEQIDDMVQAGSSMQGDRKNRRILGRAFPSSVFASKPGERPLFPADGLAHGTAMTEMVFETADPRSSVHALELPRSVLRDLSGGLMRMIFDFAIRSLVKNALGPEQENKGGPPFSIVILAAFGFVGGPQSPDIDPPEFLANIQRTLDELRANGIDVTLVLPMGNHRQHRAHARLRNGDAIGWQIQPDDHTSNVLEIIHRSDDRILELTSPGERPEAIEVKDGLTFLIRTRAGKIGALTTTIAGKGGWSRTRVCLAATATTNRNGPRAPAGNWTIRFPEAEEVRVWVMRDETGFEADPRQPARRSWLVDKHYTERDASGAVLQEDPATHGLRVLRAGTASLLTAYSQKVPNAGGKEAIIPVAAGWKGSGDHDIRETPYSGAAFDGVTPVALVDLAKNAKGGTEPVGPFGQRGVLGNGSTNRFRVSGTSLAAALHAGDVARGGQGKPEISEA